MIKKLRALWALMQAGNRVADPVKWKTRQIETTMITALIWAIVQMAEALGVSVPLDDEIADGMAVGVIAVVNFVLTYTTTSKIGIDGPRQPL